MAQIGNDDDAIKRRLFNEGDSGADERRINTLIRTYGRWLDLKPGEERDLLFERILCQLSQCRNAMEKTQLVHEMNLLEQENYENLNSEIEQAIMLSKKNIADAKKDLQYARTIRRNRQEYDALAKIIKEHPERKTTESKISELKEELGQLNESRRCLRDKLELRKKQLTAIVTTIHEMQRTLREEENIEANSKLAVEDGEMDTS
ncbi:DgyrCDS11414 [Dimorphilus gyrociliatus]|uniref:DgyrCDS11414 n=1 Tax=Dimorphilus gyrociliatus TaxID=2664684 RepID=A0A7I8W3E6_9ANNE|nr:DgyrCDS11414 [Dimorphilus gyrociliatus]